MRRLVSTIAGSAHEREALHPAALTAENQLGCFTEPLPDPPPSFTPPRQLFRWFLSPLVTLAVDDNAQAAARIERRWPASNALSCNACAPEFDTP
jgi:hypothetical protein